MYFLRVLVSFLWLHNSCVFTPPFFCTCQQRVQEQVLMWMERDLIWWIGSNISQKLAAAFTQAFLARQICDLSGICQLKQTLIYLGDVFGSYLTSWQHIKKIATVIKFSLANFHHIRPFLLYKWQKQMHCTCNDLFSCCYDLVPYKQMHWIKPPFKNTIKI